MVPRVFLSATGFRERGTATRGSGARGGRRVPSGSRAARERSVARRGGGRPGASAGPVGVARGRARDGAFSRLERAERSERATGHCFGVPLPGADRSVRDFFPLPVNEKNYRVDARKRELKKTRSRTPRSNARSGRGPRPEERPRDVMRLCFTTSHPPARALPLAAAVVVVVAPGPPLRMVEKKFLIITRRASVLPRPSSPSDHHPGVLVSSVYSFALRLFFPFTRPRSWGS